MQGSEWAGARGVAPAQPSPPISHPPPRPQTPPRSSQRFAFKHNLYRLREERDIRPSAFGALVSATLYERRFAPYFCSPVIGELANTSSGVLLFVSVVVGCWWWCRFAPYFCSPVIGELANTSSGVLLFVSVVVGCWWWCRFAPYCCSRVIGWAVLLFMGLWGVAG